MNARSRRVRMYYERRIFFFAVLAGLPGSAVALLMLWTEITIPRPNGL